VAQKYKKADVFIRDLFQMIKKVRHSTFDWYGIAIPNFGGRHTCHTASGAPAFGMVLPFEKRMLEIDVVC